LKKNLIYVYPSKSTFILRDLELLENEYNISHSFFDVSNKYKVPLRFASQFFLLLKKIRKTNVIICHFAGYSTILPVLFSKWFGKPCLIIVAGNDGSKFTGFNYGNFTRKLLGSATCFSLTRATHILPVHESLYFQNYTYYDGGSPAQGYSVFCPNAAKVPYTPVYYGYNPDFFKPIPDSKRKPLSYLTIGNLSETYSYKRKGYDLIIELGRRMPEINITLIGWDGKTSIDVPENVTLLPYMAQEDLLNVFSEHQFYFQLSIMEGFPNALAEAMLCGCIPIGSDVSGIPFIIGETGFVLKKRELDLLVDLIAKTKELNHTQLEALSIAAQNRIQNEFSFQRRKNSLIELIQKYSKDE
jgi:glycosyltransferase involved in cell wall biosynthesis